MPRNSHCSPHNERVANERAHPLTRAAVPYDATDTATIARVGAAPPRRRERRDGNGNGKNGRNGIGDDGGDGGISGMATAANREHNHVSAFACAPMASNEPRCAHVGGCGRAYLGARRRSRPRSRKSSEPGSEAGTHRSGGQSRTVKSALPLGSALSRQRVICPNRAVDGNHVACARTRELQKHAQMTPYLAAITRI